MVSLTVIVPTFNEGVNVSELVAKLDLALLDHDAEILFVDDSTDDTPDVIRATQGRALTSVRMIHRTGVDRVGGLSGAVVAGIKDALGEIIVVMDSDLQHPPSDVPRLVRVLYDADMSIASRYCGNGTSAGLSSGFRQVVSSGSTAAARGLFPKRVGKNTTDPMTGFFCFRKSAVDVSRLKPDGFKILLEILATHDLSVNEMPFSFGSRHAGTSKADWKNGVSFLRQLARLRFSRVSKFGLVGLLGMITNLLVMAGLVSLHVNYVVAAVLATQVAIIQNFVLQERYVFHKDLHGSWWSRAVQAVALNNIEIFVRLPMLALMVEVWHVNALVAQAITIGVAFFGRYFVMSQLVYKPWRFLGFIKSRSKVGG